MIIIFYCTIEMLVNSKYSHIGGSYNNYLKDEWIDI